MGFWSRASRPIYSPVLVIDALGFTAKIKACGPGELDALSKHLDRQYHRFRSKVPFGIVAVTSSGVSGSREFSTFRLNDMFVLFTERPREDAVHRHLVSTVLLQQVLLLEGFIPRGGLGAGLVIRSNDSILGGGFIDAYDVAEKRPDHLRHICAVQLSHAFLERVPQTKFSSRLLRFYEGAYFVDPLALVDPDMGKFDIPRVMDLLQQAGIDEVKMRATAKFFEESEDYDTAANPRSRSWAYVHSRGGPAGPDIKDA
jgi:hypothetical protein